MRSLAAALVWIAVPVVFAAGCSARLPDGEFTCTTSPECPTGFSCSGGLCYRGDVGADAFTPTPDSGMDGAVGIDAAASPDAGTDAAVVVDVGVDAAVELHDAGTDAPVPSLDGWYVYTEPGPLAPAGSFSGALMQLAGMTLSEGPCFPACGGACAAPYHAGCGHFDHVLVETPPDSGAGAPDAGPVMRTFSTTETYDIHITIDHIDASHNLSGTSLSGGFPNTFAMQFLGTATP